MSETPSAPSGNPAGELVFSTAANKAHLSRMRRAGKAVRLTTGVYVVGASLPVETVVREHLWNVIAHFWPDAVVCDRTAFDGGRTDWIFICHPDPPRVRDLLMPGVTVKCRIGPGPLPGDSRWMDVLYLSSTARALLENAEEVGRPAENRPSRAAGLKAVGDQIDALASSGDHSRLKTVFHVFDQIQGYFNQATVTRVRALLAAASGTYSGGEIASERLAARVSGTPYDAARVELFRKAVAELESLAPIVRPDNAGPESRQWLPFFEAYFSNYIEGTRFSVEEAFDIAINNEVPAARPKDAHDVSATFRIVSDHALMQVVPRDGDDLVEILKDRHRVLMAARPEKRPGQFKDLPNYAGATSFVAPLQTEGTLRAGWELLNGLVDPFHRAVMMMFLVSECHPFDDGNGRVARILTNAELVARGQHRIVIATSYRNNYLAALTGATAGNGVTPLVSVLDFTRKWVAVVDWSDWDRCRADLGSSNAFEDPGVAEHSGKVLRLPSGP
ncbi:Fic family protein [Nocardioides panacihumi]|uniref:Fic family protein n=2 Tax=Nocardioides panacihumi TaxID=400774 RepID=A0ABP5C6T8_9ACTN